MNQRRRSKGFFRRPTQGRSEEVDAMLEEERRIAELIEQRERFLTDLPRRAQENLKEEDEQIMPPPEEVIERKREHVFNAMLSDNQIRNHRRYETKSKSIMIMLGIAALSLFAWAWKIAQSGF